MMKHVLTNCFENNQSLYQPLPQIYLLHPNSINLICDASSIYSTGNNIQNAAIANAVVYYNPFINDFAVHSTQPIAIKSDSNSLSEEVSLLVGLENLQMSGIKQPNHNVLNVFTDSTYVLRKFIPLFNHIKALKTQGSSPADILNSMKYSMDTEQLVAYYLVLLNMCPNMYHLKAHTNNLGYISKDFKINNGVNIREEELIYLTSVQAMVDSLATKMAKNVI